MKDFNYWLQYVINESNSDLNISDKDIKKFIDHEISHNSSEQIKFKNDFSYAIRKNLSENCDLNYIKYVLNTFAKYIK